MSNAIEIKPSHTAAELRRLAARTRDADQSRRLLAIAAVLDGMSRADAARIGGMDRQTLRDWVHRFNASGPDGLKTIWGSGRQPRLSAAQKAELAEIVEIGPDPAVDGVVRWRRIDLKRVIEDRFGVVYHERSVGKLLEELGFSHISGRPQHPGQNAKVTAAFKKTSPNTLAAHVSGIADRKRIEIWFQDEARLGQKNGRTRLWAKTGTRPPVAADQRYKNAYLFGAICPKRGVGAGLMMPKANTHAMQAHLDEISLHVAAGAHAVVLMDRAGWHTTDKLAVPDNISIVLLPSRSPELNPVENIWQYLRQNWLSNRVFETYDDILDAGCQAWNNLVAQPHTITSIGMRKWAHTG
ncbi:MAG: IS630 family transposase, partial [Hyphomicrobiales bacterium]